MSDEAAREHPLTAALAAMIREEFSGYRYMDPDTPERIAADWLDRILRHPAMREPSEAVVDAAFNAQPIPSMRAPKGWMTTAWRAGCEALAREIEEASR